MKRLLCLTGVLLLTIATYAQDCNLNEDARRYWVRANAAIKEAQNEEDYLNAVEEFKKALEYAPDCPDIYYNIGMCYDKSASSGLLKDIWGCGKAMEYLKKYLEVKPDAQNKQEVQNKIYELEYKKEKLNKILSPGGFLGIDDNRPLSNILSWFVDMVVLIDIKDNNQIDIRLDYNLRYDETGLIIHVESVSLVADNYKTKEGVEYLKFCVQNLKHMHGKWDKKKNVYKNPGDYTIIGCCYYLKLIDGRFALEFEPKYIHQYVNDKETQKSINLNSSIGRRKDIFNKIYEGEIKYSE